VINEAGMKKGEKHGDGENGKNGEGYKGGKGDSEGKRRKGMRKIMEIYEQSFMRHLRTKKKQGVVWHALEQMRQLENNY
jgi:hypothetical protein